jgi:hypothetical protein
MSAHRCGGCFLFKNMILVGLVFFFSKKLLNHSLGIYEVGERGSVRGPIEIE